MKVVIIKDGETIVDNLGVTNIKSILSLVQLNHGQELVDDIISHDYKYVLQKGEDVIALQPEVLFSDLSGYDTLFIIQDIGGELPAAAVAGALTAMGVGGVTAASTSVIILTAVLNMAISIAFSAIMNALSPTPEFDGDPSGKQKSSNLFNGSVINREQGGIVPYIFGRCFCGGVLISASVETMDE